MTVRCVMVVSAILLASGTGAGDDKKDDKDQLQGEWVVVSMKQAGKEVYGAKGKKLVVKGNQWTPPTSDLKLTFKINASKNPKQLNLMSEKGKTWKAIYKIEGDKLTFCRIGAPSPFAERPTDFKDSDAFVLMICKRAGK